MFTSVGYGMHLTQTRNPACVQIYQDYLAYDPSDTESETSAIDEHDDNPIPFEGDFFGAADEYGDDDFEGMASDEEEMGSEEDDNGIGSGSGEEGLGTDEEGDDDVAEED